MAFGAHGIGRINDDDIVLSVGAGHEIGAVADHQGGSRIIEGAPRDRREVLLTKIDDARIDFDKRDAINGMLKNFLEGAAVAAADDQYAPCCAVRHQGNVGHISW